MLVKVDGAFLFEPGRHIGWQTILSQEGRFFGMGLNYLSEHPILAL